MIEYLVLHDSDSPYGNPFIIDQWHEKRGFKWEHKASGTFIHVGYHYLVLNGRLFSSSEYIPEFDGLVIPCRPETAEGAHCYSNDGNPNNDRNRDSLGICFIGASRSDFTGKQLSAGLELCFNLKKKHKIQTEKIVGHKEQDPQNKKDPRLDMESFRFFLNQLEGEKNVG